MFQMVLQFKPWGERDFDDLIRVEDHLIELLRGDAKVDGHDSGSDEVNIFIFCADPPSVLGRCVEAAEAAGFLPILSVAYRVVLGDVYTRLWPKGVSSPFEVK